MSGADKITINTQAVKTPNLIMKVSSRYGNQCVVVAIDAKKIQDDWYVYLVGGREKQKKLKDWALEVQDRGAGEILFTSWIMMVQRMVLLMIFFQNCQKI